MGFGEANSGARIRLIPGAWSAEGSDTRRVCLYLSGTMRNSNGEVLISHGFRSGPAAEGIRAEMLFAGKARLHFDRGEQTAILKLEKLLQNKQASGRPKDLDDLAFLKKRK